MTDSKTQFEEEVCVYCPALSQLHPCSLRPLFFHSVSLSFFPALPVIKSRCHWSPATGSRKWFQPQAPEEPRPAGSQPGPRPSEGVLHVCLERVGQLELWLRKAQSSLVASGAAGSPTMQDSVEQQLLTCQEMFLEIEQKVASLSASGLDADQQLQQQDELGAVWSQQEVAELLSSKLELLKANLVSFQQLLQDKQKSDPQPEHHLESQLKRSSSVQEIFSSPRNKLLRQSSLQQQKEFEQKLTEQRGLTQAIARQGSRTRLVSQDPEDNSQLSPWSPPAAADEEEDSAQKKWDRLHSQLLGLEESWLLPPSVVTDSSTRRSDGTAGRMIGTQTLKELQTHISHLRELGHTATQCLNQLHTGVFIMAVYQRV